MISVVQLQFGYKAVKAVKQSWRIAQVILLPIHGNGRVCGVNCVDSGGRGGQCDIRPYACYNIFQRIEAVENGRARMSLIKCTTPHFAVG